MIIIFLFDFTSEKHQQVIKYSNKTVILIQQAYPTTVF